MPETCRMDDYSVKLTLKIVASSWCFHLLIYDARNQKTQINRLEGHVLCQYCDITSACSQNKHCYEFQAFLLYESNTVLVYRVARKATDSK